MFYTAQSSKQETSRTENNVLTKSMSQTFLLLAGRKTYKTVVLTLLTLQNKIRDKGRYFFGKNLGLKMIKKVIIDDILIALKIYYRSRALTILGEFVILIQACLRYGNMSVQKRASDGFNIYESQVLQIL